MKYTFPDNFWWGSASSALQTEGTREGETTWDYWFAREPNRFHNGVGPQHTSTFYQHWKTDIQLLKQLNHNSFRTSISWARLIPDGIGEVNPKAVEFYNQVIDELIEQGITPFITLFHFDMPMAMQEIGGWENREVVDAYARYAQICFDLFGDRVLHWFTFNEPIVVQTRVYLDALRWPYEQNTGTWIQWNHHKVLATAKVVKLFREKGHRGSVGCILNPEVTYPRSCAPHDLRAAEMYDLFYNRVFLDPLVHGRYPAELFTLLEQHQVEWEYTADELALIADNTVDELGINLYYPHRVKAPSRAWHPDTPFHPAYYYEPFELPGRRMNRSRGWEIYPRIIYDMAMRIKNDYRNIDWFVAESGMGVENEAQFRNRDGIIDDTYRIDFISEHLYYTLLAREEGANCHGYMLWAFTDNVSPMNAFKNRYGLIEIDLDNQRARRAKKSAFWFRQLRDTRRLTLQVDDEWK